MGMRVFVLTGLLLGGRCLAADVTGDWDIAAKLGEISIAVHCRLEQSGDELTGSCTPVMENPETSTLAGSVDGTRIRWSYDIVFNGNPGRVAYEGELESDSRIAGDLDLSGTPTEFTATRATDAVVRGD